MHILNKKNMDNKIVFRVDSSFKMGSGHVMRCLALADALRQRGEEVLFVCRELPGNMCKYIEDKEYQVYRLPYCERNSGSKLDENTVWSGETWKNDFEQTSQIVKLYDLCSIKWLIVDHYGLDMQWEQRMRTYVQHIMVIDDLANRKHDCDVLLDQNLYTDMKTRYLGLVSARTETLLGPQYAMLRSEFYEARKNLRERSGEVKNILVFFGGSDPTNETMKTLQAIQLLNRIDIHTTVVVGNINVHKEQIKEMCQGMSNTEFYCQINNMAKLMANSDLAIGAGGGTTWERLCLGLPAMVLRIADNQDRLTKDTEQAGLLFDIGVANSVKIDILVAALQKIIADQQRLKLMSHCAVNVVDGMGVEKVLECLNYVAVHLRPATDDDVMKFYDLVCDPKVQQMSFSQNNIPLETHIRWFAKTLLTESLFVVEKDGELVGQVRVNKAGEVDITISPLFSGNGYGTMALKLINQRPLIAHIKQENYTSIKTFERADFTSRGIVEYKGHKCLEYIKL